MVAPAWRRCAASLRAAASHEIAYRGDGAPEIRAESIAGWKRLLDLVEERAGVDATDLFRVWVVDETSAPLLDAREEARRAYENLVTSGEGWSPPYALRGPLAGWQFPQAMKQIATANEVLSLRTQIDARAAALGVAVPPGLEAAYEGALVDVGAATPVAKQRLDGLAEIESAVAAIAGPRDVMTEIGLLTEPPVDERLEMTKDAFEAGDFATVAAESEALEATLDAAPEVGRTRVVGGSLVIVISIVGIGAVVFIGRSRRRRARIATGVAASAAATLPATSPGDAAGFPPADPVSEGGDGPTDDGRSAPG